MARLALRTLAPLILALACGGEPAAPEQEQEVGDFLPEAPLVPVPASSAPRDAAVVEVEGFGTIRFELLADLAPESVARFVELAEAGHYDGTTFHRVLPGFMIQGGDPNSRDRDPRNDGQGTSLRLPDEFSEVSHVAGIVSFANRGRPGTSDGQFFILVGENRNLDGAYTVFGRVLDGQEVADAIAAVERDKYGRWGPRDRPLEDVVMATVRIDRAGDRSDEGGASRLAAAPAPSDAEGAAGGP